MQPNFDAQIHSLRLRRVELSQQLQMQEADVRATQSHLRELDKTLAPFATLEPRFDPRDPMLAKLSKLRRPSQFQVIIDFVRNQPTRPNRKQIVDALALSLPSKAQDRVKAVCTALSALVEEGSLTLSGEGTYAIGEECTR